jgi:hypothetical protein
LQSAKRNLLLSYLDHNVQTGLMYAHALVDKEVEESLPKDFGLILGTYEFLN